MSYVNHSTGDARGVSVVAVSALHIAAAWVLINGLGIDYIKTEVFNLPTTNYPSERLPQPAPEPPKPDTRQQHVDPARPYRRSRTPLRSCRRHAARQTGPVGNAQRLSHPRHSRRQ